MRKVVSHTFMTLDGVAVVDAAMEHIVELRDTPEVLDDFFGRVAEEDAMLLGRVTYEEWADHWPTSDSEPFASHINNVPKYVVSRSLDAAPWPDHDDATLIKGDLADAVNELKQQPGGPLGVHGSPTLVEALLQADRARRDASRGLPRAGGQRPAPVQGPGWAEKAPPRRFEDHQRRRGAAHIRAQTLTQPW